MFKKGIIFAEQREAKTEIWRQCINEMLEPVCKNVTLIIGEEGLLSELGKISTDAPVLVVPQKAFCFVPEILAFNTQEKGNPIQCFQGPLNSIGIYSGCIKVSHATSDINLIRSKLIEALSEIYSYPAYDELAKAIWERYLHIAEFPRVVKLELTNRCNLKCKMCLFHSDRYKSAPTYIPHDKFSDMDFLLYKKAIDECEEWYSRLPYDIMIFLANRGESLLYSHFYDAVEYATAKGLKINLVTNGTLLTKDNSARLLASGINQITVSIDEATKDGNSKIRLNSDKYDIMGNFDSLLSLKGKMQSKTSISLCLTLVGDNASAIDPLLELYIDRVNSIMVQTEYVFDMQKMGKMASTEFGSIPDNGRQPCPNLVGIDIQSDLNSYLCPCAHQTDDVFAGIYDGSVNNIFNLYNSSRLKKIREKCLISQYTREFCCTHCDVWKSFYSIGMETEKGLVKRLTPEGCFYARKNISGGEKSHKKRKRLGWLLQFFRK